MYDALISARHNGFGPTDMHKTDLSFDKLQNAKFDAAYVRSSRVRTGRSIRGLGLPTNCTRAERREVEQIFKTVTSRFQRFCTAINTVETEMKKDGYEYMYSTHLGYILTC